MKTKLIIQPIMVDIETAAEVLSISKSTIESLMRSGEFVKIRKVSPRRTCFLMAELEAWAASRPASDLLPPPNTGRNASA
jgi:prophage regulatory protein